MPGLVTLKDDGSLWRSGQYHALRHFSPHLQRDGRRIASQTDAPGLRHVAVENPDGSFALVMTNPGEAKDLRIICAGQQLSVSLSPRFCCHRGMVSSLANDLFFSRARSSLSIADKKRLFRKGRAAHGCRMC